MTARNRFLTIEGGEGAGKSTLIRFLKQELQERGVTSVATREPGGSALGEQVRNLVLNAKSEEPIAPIAELLLFLSARAQHIYHLIAPALAKGSCVICDRFNDSTIAYQSAARGLDPLFVSDLCQKVCSNTLPSLTLLIDVPPQIGFARAKGRNGKSGVEFDRMEQEGLHFHQKVREGFLKLAKENSDRIKLIDGSLPLEGVKSAALKVVLEWMNSWKVNC